MTDASAPETTVPDGETPAATCPHCGRPFREERLCALHVGETHPDAATESDRESYERARGEESDDLFVFHLKVVAAIVVTYMSLIYLYGFVLTG